MKLALVTDAWQPQVNGVVTTLLELVRELRDRGHQVEVIEPGLFRTMPCPGYAGIDLALWPARRLGRLLDAAAPDAIHIATEGPLGWAARRHCLRRGLAFSTAFHTKFPEILHAFARVPLSWGYALFRHFHRPSRSVMVPTQGVLAMLARRGFGQLRPWTHGVDTELFAFAPVPTGAPLLDGLPRPLALYVGRVSHEKSIQDFLRIAWPGTRVVCGVGPALAGLRRDYAGAGVHWLGVLPRDQLARLYAAADVFVFPSRSETFGLVMLEAMACGTPVAAYPVDGPLEVLGDGQGGVLDIDLGRAAVRALEVPREAARARAMAFDWARTAELFVRHLVPAQGPATEVEPAGQDATAPGKVTEMSQERHILRS